MTSDEHTARTHRPPWWGLFCVMIAIFGAFLISGVVEVSEAVPADYSGVAFAFSLVVFTLMAWHMPEWEQRKLERGLNDDQ